MAFCCTALPRSHLLKTIEMEEAVPQPTPSPHVTLPCTTWYSRTNGGIVSPASLLEMQSQAPPQTY